MRLIRNILFVLLMTPLATHAADIRTGDDVLRAMHDHYQASWYQTVTFTQKSTTYKPDGTSSAETWYEALSVPGKLRIDIGPASDGNGYIFDNGNITIVKGNKVTGTRHSVNILLVLGFDVYGQDAATTAKVVKDEGYDLSKVHEDTWEENRLTSSERDKGDLESKQFWVAKDTLLFVRVIEPTRQTLRNSMTCGSPTIGRWPGRG